VVGRRRGADAAGPVGVVPRDAHREVRHRNLHRPAREFLHVSCSS
jgi:hypothetical protein